MLILPIIFPKTDLADFILSTSVKGFVAATRATVGFVWLVRLGNVFKHAGILHSILVTFPAGSLNGKISARLFLK